MEDGNLPRCLRCRERRENRRPSTFGTALLPMSVGGLFAPLGISTGSIFRNQFRHAIGRVVDFLDRFGDLRKGTTSRAGQSRGLCLMVRAIAVEVIKPGAIALPGAQLLLSFDRHLFAELCQFVRHGQLLRVVFPLLILARLLRHPATSRRAHRREHSAAF